MKMLIALLVLLPAWAQAATITVDGTSIQGAVDNAAVGDSIIVIGGSEASPRLYPERVYVNEGVALSADPRRSVLMYGFDITGEGTSVEGFQVTIPAEVQAGDWKAAFAIHITSADSVVVRDNYIYDAENGIHVHHTQPWPRAGVIEGNHIYGCSMGMTLHGSNWLVANNEIERLVNRGGDSDYSRAFGDSMTFRGNHFHGTALADIGAAHVDGLQTFTNNGFGLTDVLFEDNILSAFHQGILLESEGVDGGVSNIVVRNNVFSGSFTDGPGGAFGVSAKWGVTNLSVTHNLIANMEIHGLLLRYGAEGTVVNNIFYNAGSNYQADANSFLTGGYNLLNREGYPNYKDPSDVVGVDPLFVDVNDWPGGGYKLLASSPAIDAGTDAGVTTDILGSPRPQNGAYDIGPYEFPSSSSPPTPEGLVHTQDPVAGSVLPLGSSVNLVVSLGPPQVVVPNVVELEQSVAEALIVGANLRVGVVTTQHSFSVDVGSVISQAPGGGVSVRKNSVVDLVVSLGPSPISVPDVVGLSQLEAETVLLLAELTLGPVSSEDDLAVPEGYVISQSPAAGTIVALGSSVSITVSLGPPTGVVPDVLGTLQEDAEAMIVAAGFVVGIVTTQYVE